MSLELYILSERRLTSIGEWQRSIDAMDLPLRLSSDVPFARLRGALPVLLDGSPSHFECDHWDREDLLNTYPDFQFEQRLQCILAMRWGGDIASACSAYTAAAAYAKATGGSIFECQEGAMISPERAVEIADELKQSGPMIAAAVRAVMQKFGKKGS